jgi:hypothetical protein
LTYYSIPFFQAINVKTGIYSQSDQNQMTKTFLSFSLFMFLLFFIGWLLTTHRLNRHRDK